MRWNLFLSLILALGAATFLVTTEAPVDDPIWWYTNDQPPELTIQGPSGPLRGTAEAIVQVSPADRIHLLATIDGQPLSLASSAAIAVDTTGLKDGPHRVVVTARDTSRRQNTTAAEWTFVADNTGPTLDVQLGPQEGPVEGSTTVITIHPSEPTSVVSGELEGRKLRLQPSGDGGYWALEGVPPEPAYREMTLKVKARDVLGNESTWSKTYPLIRTKFPSEDLEFDPSKDELADPQVRAEEDAKLMQVYEKDNGPRLWSGPFIEPVEAPVTTEFATRRSYNGRYPQGNHAGMDFGAPMATPIKAPADGVVAFAETVPLRGNCMVLSHGAGVYSTYGHLSRFNAIPGQRVKQGDVIGYEGSTGLSTGPHLHWEIWVDMANVNPLDWTKRAYP